jgi:hypothetical protein
VAGVEGKMLYNPEIVWNVRPDPELEAPLYDKQSRQLTIYTDPTIPDSGHRHLAYYLLGEWKRDPSLVPNEVEIEPQGETVGSEEIVRWLEKLDLKDTEHTSVLVSVFSVPAEREGRLFDEYNEEGKKASNAAAIDMFDDKTPSRRFVKRLMNESQIFNRVEVETRMNTIGSKSRKLTTNATLDSAIRPFSKDLLKLEKGDPATMEDLIDFFSEFFEEWSNHYPQYKPLTDAAARHELRRKSFALSNMVFFPMFRIAMELWETYFIAGKVWRTDSAWKAGLAKLAGDVTFEEDGKRYTVPVMSRDVFEGSTLVERGNAEWRGKVLVQRYASDGTPAGWSLSNNLQSRAAAYHYLVSAGGFQIGAKAPSAKK